MAYCACRFWAHTHSGSACAARGGRFEEPSLIRYGILRSDWPAVAFDTEDDGETFAYLEGQVARTRMSCARGEGEITVVIQPRAGSYEGMPADRCYDVRLHTQATPIQVWVNDQPVAQGDGALEWRYDGEERTVRLTVREDPTRLSPQIVRFQGVV